MKMLVFSFAFGIIHLFTSAWELKLYCSVKSGHLVDGIYDAVFWYMLVGGAIVYMLTMSMFTGHAGVGLHPSPRGRGRCRLQSPLWGLWAWC